MLFSEFLFSIFWGQTTKNITIIEQNRLFLFTFLVLFFMAFLAQKLIYTISIYDLAHLQVYVWLIFWTRSTIKLYLFQKFTQKDDLNKPVFQYKNWCSLKSDPWFFF